MLKHARREVFWLVGLSACAALCAFAAGGWGAQPAANPGLPDGPTWGRGGFQPKAANQMFATGDGCALCHSASAKAGALWSPTGEDVSPHGLWKSTLMAHAAKDPYWRAQVAKETAAAPDRAAEIEGLCNRCHTPMGHQTQLAAGGKPLGVAEAASHPLYGDGVSCTVCHQIQPEGLGTPARFDGNIEIKPGRKIFGPFADPGAQPMIMHSAFTPTQADHIRSSGLCAGCHTLGTEHAGRRFPEQSPFLEWRNSIYTDEGPGGAGGKGGRTRLSRSCADCHMPDVGPMRIARNPAGLDFNIQTRGPVRGHTFVGGNAFMLDILRTNAEALGVTASAESLERTARATRAQLSHRTATIEIENLRREKAADGTQTLVFEAVVTNLTGHKFPTGYPARRAWVDAEVRDGRKVVFESGGFDKLGRIEHIADELAVPHFDTIESQDQVAIYEMVAADETGKPTTYLARMATRLKDTRLLPEGYKPDGPHASDTAPQGLNGDTNFVGGSDRVTYRVKLQEGAGARLTVVARILYQTIPPAWAEPLRTLDAQEAKSFISMYDTAVPKPEQVAVTVAFEEK